MNHAKTLFVLALALATVPSRALAGYEALARGAEKSFANAAAFRSQPLFGQILVQTPPAQLMPSVDWVSLSVAGHIADVSVQSAAAEVGAIDLATLLNRQLKSPLKYNLGGKDVWISGAFDRKQTAYVSILVDGSEAVFFNVKGLMDKEERVAIGAATYKVSLSPDIFNRMNSEIILENAADADDQVRITVKKMIEGIHAGGAPVAVSGQRYMVFYTDDVKAGRADSTVRSFTFILIEPSGKIHVYLIPAEHVSADQIAVYKMFRNARVGLSQKDGKLKIYENP